MSTLQDLENQALKAAFAGQDGPRGIVIERRISCTVAWVKIGRVRRWRTTWKLDGKPISRFLLNERVINSQLFARNT